MLLCKMDCVKSGPLFTKHSQEQSMSFSSCEIECNITSYWLNHMLLNIEKSGEQDKERSLECKIRCKDFFSIDPYFVYLMIIFYCASKHF